MAINKFLKAAKDIQEETPRPPKKSAPPEEGEGWLISYADMMTLLCGFFVMMYSMASLDVGKFEKVQEAMAKQFGGDFKSPNAEMAKFVTNVIQESGVDKDVVITSDPYGVSVVFHSTVFFDTLSADLKPEGKMVLEKLIDLIAKQQEAQIKKFRIVVEGHTDSRPILGGNYPSNWELSGSRAGRVVRTFLSRGFSPEKLTAIGYADTYPQVPARLPNGEWDPAALAKNRRVVIRILQPAVDSIPFPDSPRATAPVKTPSSQAAEPTKTGSEGAANSAVVPSGSQKGASAAPPSPPSAVPAPNSPKSVPQISPSAK